MKQGEEKRYMTKQAYRRRYQNPKRESRSQLFEHGFPLTHRNHKTETQGEVNTPRKEKKTKTDIVCGCTRIRRDSAEASRKGIKQKKRPSEKREKG